MDSALIGIVVTAVVTLGGAWLAFRGTKATSDTTGLAAAAEHWQAMVERQDKKITEMDERITKVSDENRLFRRTLVGVIERLRRVPPPAHDLILDYILDNIPSLKEKP